ncbi:MAG: hypothetical protein DWQ06_05560 [Calditrichaeota bacterium]|nr:MAG: hypothetical protein DWQ06_05560 [Calditrichota bacterium]
MYKNRTFLAISIFVLAISQFVTAQKLNFGKITFSSEDGLEITADKYISNDLNAPFIILFHQAGWSRGEYLEIAPKLNKLGYNCLAVDQRSGNKVNEIQNETFKRAKEAGKETNFLDAYQDMKATVDYVKENFAKGQLIVWGSSYSASLVLKLASEKSDKINGVLSFAPGEYFKRFGESETFIQDSAKNIKCPVFITSAKDEKQNWIQIFDSIPTKSKQYFVPETKGNHGSRALWDKFEDSENYWSVVKAFLSKHFQDC